MSINVIRSRYICIFVILTTFSSINPARAQIEAPSPRFDAGRVEERLPEQKIDPQREKPIGLPMLEGLQSDTTIPDSTESGPRFEVRSVIVQQSTVFDEATLQRAVEVAIGDDISLNDLKRAAANITKLYHDKGYVFSKAIIPPQKIKEKTVMVEVIEGYISDVEIRGAELSPNSPIYGYADRLTSLKPISQAMLERYILLINDMGGVSAKVIAAPVDQSPGALQLVLLVDQYHHDAFTSLNNRGSDSLGPAQLIASYQTYDAFSNGEQTKLLHLRTPTNNELSYYSFSQKWFLGDDGMTLEYFIRRSEAEPGENAAAFDIDSQSHSYGLSVSYPWIRSRQETFSTSLSFDMRDSSTESFDTEIIDDHLRYLRAGADYRRVHNSGVTQIDTTFSYGLDIFGASQADELKLSRANASSSSNKWQLSVRRFQLLSDHWSINLNATGQWGFDRLLSAELFGLGGSEFGRAFNYSTITGESGAAALAQINYTVADLHESVQQFTPFAFIDGGYAYDDISRKKWQSIASAGAGIQLGLFDYFNAKLELAKPLHVESGLENSLEIYGTIGMRLQF